MEKSIKLSHGSGARMTHDLIREVFRPYFTDPKLTRESDSAILELTEGSHALSTDAFVVDPVFFPGGDIGKLAVCGTANDLAVSGAKPAWMAVSFILEEGFPLAELERIACSMADETRQMGIDIVTADTKVVPKGHGDKIFITTTGLGKILEGYESVSTGENIRPGDHVIVTGPVGDHGAAIFASRAPGILKTEIQSDCACVFPMINEIMDWRKAIRFMRDPTRGGMATVLCEITENRDWGILLEESAIPVRPGVKAICDLAGLDPLYLACEGRIIIITAPESSIEIVRLLNGMIQGAGASVIGTVTGENTGRVAMKTEIGGTRVITMLAGDPLPRIC